MSLADAKVLSREPLDPTKAKWLKCSLATYRDPKGIVRTYEFAERLTRPATSDVDGVCMIAIIQKATGPEIILQKQYRAPLDCIVIELPAGLVDANESAPEAAIRELKEESGYTGVVTEESTIMYNEPGISNTSLRLLHMTIDPLLPANNPPVPSHEDDEFIEVFSLPVGELWANCKKFEEMGYAIDVSVGALAEGIEMRRRLGL